MSDDEGQSVSGALAKEQTDGSGELNNKTKEHLNLKQRRAQLRGKITRPINIIKKFIDQGTEMRKRIEKETRRLLRRSLRLPKRK